MAIPIGAIFALETIYGSAMSAPDFVAGFIYGMTGDNHLTEIEACAKFSQEEVLHAQDAVKKIESGDYTTGFIELGQVINQIPDALSNCQNMGGDIDAIENWAKIFEQPKELSETLAKNWLLHRKTIKADLAAEQSDWATGSYFQAGVDTALALTEAVGPIKTTSNGITGDVTNMGKFVAGFVSEMTGDLELDEITACIDGASDLD